MQIGRISRALARASRIASCTGWIALASACGGDSVGGVACMPGTAKRCTCPDMRPAIASCMPNGQLGACQCIVQGAPSPAADPAPGAAAGMGPVTPPPPILPTGTSGGLAGMSAAVGGSTGVGQAGRFGGVPPAGAPGFPAPAGGSGVPAPPASGAAGVPAAGAPTPAPAGGATGGGVASDEIEMARQVCVDEINRYRATLMLPALMRGTPAQEMCSDMGAKKDGDSGRAHGSASDCRSMGLPGQQDTCPGWGVGGRTGNATLSGALTRCLMQMWAEGEPPQGREACIADRTGCFQMHGHYLNMSDPTPKVVACGFYQMMDGRWWMNQNFGR